MSYTHAVYSIEVVGKLFVFHAFIDIPSSLVETKLIYAKVQRALRSIFHGAQSKLSTEDTDRWKFIHGGHGSSEFKRNLNGYFGVARAQEILEEIFNKEWPGPEMLWIHGAHGGHGWLMSRER